MLKGSTDPRAALGSSQKMINSTGRCEPESLPVGQRGGVKNESNKEKGNRARLQGPRISLKRIMLDSILPIPARA